MSQRMSKGKELGALRVLMQIRPNAESQRGGDTVVLHKLAAALKNLGHTVDVDERNSKNPADYDIAHLFNFATPEITETQAKNCVEANTPFVVTALYEDWPFFFHQMVENFFVLKDYIEQGQKRETWDELYRSRKKVDPSERQDNYFTATNADAIFVSGEYERNSVLRDYPHAKLVATHQFGCQITPAVDGGELFKRETGLEDFILCVGRLEWRKNQLMLLKALELSDIPVVLATGGFTYQPLYEDLVRKFRRKGETIFLGRLEPEMLASAFAASRAHVLPSWFELPGLVSLEAALYGTNVVATNYGTIRDYLGDDAFYCEPGNAESIYNAVMAAYYTPKNDNLKKRVEDFSWDSCAMQVDAVYTEVLKKRGYRPVNSAAGNYSDRATTALRTIEGAAIEASQASSTVSLIPQRLNFVEQPREEDIKARDLCDQADRLLRTGKVAEARALYKQAIEIAPGMARPHRSLGVAALTVQSFEEARGHFNEALRYDPTDARSQTGLASIEWECGDKEQAFAHFESVLQENPQDLPTLLHFIQASYTLDKMPELERVLRKFLERDRNNVDMNFCLAGCLFRQSKLEECRRVIRNILTLAPTYSGAKELRDMIDQRESNGAKPDFTPIVPRAAMIEISIEQRIASIEEFQREKKYEKVLEGAQELLGSPQVSSEQVAQLLVLKGEAFACKGELESAESQFQHAETSQAWGYRAISGRGVVEAVRGQWEDAEEFFERSLELRPNYDVALAGIGMCSMQQGDSRKAWDYYTRALKSNPENMRALLGVIQLGYAQNRLTEVEHYICEYLNCRPANLSILYSYAGCLYAQGKYEEALRQLDKIMIFDPQHQLANELRGKIDEVYSGRAAASR